MAAAYDQYDYQSYWEGREYEHKCEVLVIKELLAKIPKIAKILDIGCGYGRLAPYYLHRAKKIVLTDPSSKNLKVAQHNIEELKDYKNKVFFRQSTLENLPKRIKTKQFDLVLLIRVMHHLENPEKSLITINKLLSDRGYLIIEFANKLHWKAVFKNIIHGNFTFPLEIFPTDIRSKKNIKKKTLPFKNYHPEIIKELLTNNKFEILEMRSVSNVRSPIIKKYLPLSVLMSIEEFFQKSLSFLQFGPSVFILAQKKGGIEN